ncbi:hypothetical protein ACQP0C_40765 [Nocardia sp. CA-129566]|uniref:hypothetical protein n=1 Tax=Nocardia sp. CA-129566 TaxID=3239976 RepID=UPI003D97D4EC
METATAEILHRQLVLPVRAVRAGLGVSGGDPSTLAGRTDTVVPALTAAADRVTAAHRRLDRSATQLERKAAAKNYNPAPLAARRAAIANARAAVDGLHADLNRAIRSLDR